MGKEIINGPFDVYLAPVGEAYPDINVAPAGNWTKIGTNAARHYNEEGVKVEHTQELDKFRGLGGTELLKVNRVLEEQVVSFILHDLVSGEFARGFNLSTATTDTAATSGTGGHQSFNLLRGLTVTEMALLIRGEDKSPDLATENVQYEIPRVVQNANLELVFHKGEPAGLAFELLTVADYTYNSGNSPYGRLLIGDEVAL